jgi:hypothetical protein
MLRVDLMRYQKFIDINRAALSKEEVEGSVENAIEEEVSHE